MTRRRDPSRTWLRGRGYLCRYSPDHPTADAQGVVYVHRQVAWDAGILTDLSDQVHHRNGDKLDNRPENLEAVAHGEHLRLHDHLGNQRGSRNHAAKLDEAKVVALRADRRRGLPVREIADRYGIAEQTVKHIVARRLWKHVA